MVRTVILGMGTISVVHLTALEAMEDKVEIVGLCDIDPKKLEAYEGRYATFTDVEEMLRETSPDVAHVCLPHDQHLPEIRRLVEAGVAIFTEKPITAHASETDELLELSLAKDTPPIGVSFQNRYNPTFLNALELVRSGEYGQLRFIRGRVPWFRPLSYYETASWRGKHEQAGGGVMINQAIHTLDQMLVLGGGQAEEVRGMCGQLLGYPIDVEDSVMARMRFANGAIGLFEATLSHIANESIELKIYLERAVLEIKSGVLTLLELGDQRSVSEASELCRDVPLGGAKSYYGSSHTIAIRSFHAALAEGHDEYIHIADASPSMYTIDAIQRSSAQGQATTAIKQVDPELFHDRWVKVREFNHV